MERIGDECFCKARIEEVLLPETLREVGDNAFQNCASLKHVTFAPGSRLEKIGSGCFYNAAIESVTIPKGVREIPKFAFWQCERLKEVAFEEGSRLKRIEAQAFKKCKNLEYIEIPSGAEYIGASYFNESGLKEVRFPNILKEIG